MARFRCNSCQGEFTDVGADGARYFHACPAIVAVAVSRGGADLTVPLAAVRATDLVDVDRAGVKTRVRFDAIQPGDVRLGDTTLPRPNARNENVDPVKARAAEDDGGARKRGTRDDDLMHAVGAGVTPL